MPDVIKYSEPLVFGLDIGTRSLVGTIGYKQHSNFNIIAQCVKFHDTRAMLDGQIHDINTVGESIKFVKETLEKETGKKFNEVCIAAAGRVLKTAVGHVECEFSEDTTILAEHIYSLDMLGVEKAHEEICSPNDNKVKYYCVGYSVIKYYLNDFLMTNLENHKGTKIAADVLATFLPEEVVDGLYAAVKIAGLEVANLTLEPIAAINVAIPQNYRLLNIALVDIGAGTSDICITKDGSIIGYGMIPAAGDEITEAIAKKYLVDFNTAEKIKMIGPKKKSLTYKDVIGISHKITPEEVYSSVNEIVSNITRSISEKIKELNGGKSVSAVFVVGGGGKIHGFTDSLASYLDLPADRVALRGQEVLDFVNVLVNGVKKDSLMVTPIGICLSFYEQKNNFIFVTVNGERIKLYNNNKLTIFDAAVGYGLSNEKLFPRRGNDINYTINSKPKIVRGHQGEAAIIKLNDSIVGMNATIQSNDKIDIVESTVGEAAKLELGSLREFTNTITFKVNDANVICPKFAMVNNELKSEYYNIADGDKIEILNYYTLEQLLKFMDVIIDGNIYVNNKIATLDEIIYENFSVNWIINEKIEFNQKTNNFEEKELLEDSEKKQKPDKEKTSNIGEKDHISNFVSETKNKDQKNNNTISISVKVNDKTIILSGKAQYVFVDIFDFYPFDLTIPKGQDLIANINGQHAEYFDPIVSGDQLEIYWK